MSLTTFEMKPMVVHNLEIDSLAIMSLTKGEHFKMGTIFSTYLKPHQEKRQAIKRYEVR